MKLPIYMDYSATTPVDPRVAERLCACLTPDGIFGNPASRSHAFGWAAEEAVEEARRQVAELVNADPRELAWTSGATESDNLAIKGATHFYAPRGRHLVTVKTEHKTVLDTCRQLEREGFEVTYLDPEPSGLLDLRKLDAALRPDTILVSVIEAQLHGGGHERGLRSGTLPTHQIVGMGEAFRIARLEPSYVLRAIGREDELAHSSIRFTLGRFSTHQGRDQRLRGQAQARLGLRCPVRCLTRRPGVTGYCQRVPIGPRIAA